MINRCFVSVFMIRYKCVTCLLAVLAAFTGFSQTVKERKSMEVAFNLGVAPYNSYGYTSRIRVSWYRGAISLLQNDCGFQYGGVLEGGINRNDYWYVTPGLVFNRKFRIGGLSLYGGGMAGYAFTGELDPGSMGPAGSVLGYVTGVQLGYLQPLSKRYSFVMDGALRSAHSWFRYAGRRGEMVTTREHVLYLPVTIGLRRNL